MLKFEVTYNLKQKGAMVYFVEAADAAAARRTADSWFNIERGSYTAKNVKVRQVKAFPA
jgi:hypothetical protein